MSLTVQNINLALGGKPVLDDVSFILGDGEFLSLLGVSGAGKSTTLKVIAGLLVQDSGHVILDGKTMDDRPPHKREATVVFQDIRLFPHMSVEDNVAFALRMQGYKKSERIKKAHEVLDMVQMTGFHKRKVHEISGGQQQRVALARAIAGSPRILLLDEPFSGLDESLRDDMRMLVLELHKRLNMTTLMVTHDAYEALMMSDHIVYMTEGRVVQDATPEDLYDNPATLEAAECFGDCSTIRGVVEEGVFRVGSFSLPVEIPSSSAKAVIRNRAFHADPCGDLELEINRSVYRGDSYLVDSNFAGQDITFCSDKPLRAGSNVRLSIDRSQVFIFSDE